MAKTASFVSHVFEKIWGAGTDTPRLMQNMRAVTRTLIENPVPGGTFAEIPLLYSNEIVRAKMVRNLSNEAIIAYWEDYERKPQRERGIYLESFLNKVGAFLDEPMIRNIFAQSKTSLNFRHIMDTGKILLVKLSPEYEEASRLIGAVIIGKILLAAFSRSEIPEHARRHFSLYLDEFQNWATSDMATLISEARKFSVSTTLAHQALSQLPEANRTAAATAGNLIVFRVSGEDGKTLAPSFDSTPQNQVVIGFESERCPVADVLTHLVKRGHNDPRAVRFAQVYLKNLEDLVHRSTQYDYWRVYGEWPIDLNVYNQDIRRGRELLNESIYLCMVEKSDNRHIPPLALYILSVAQHDGSEEIFFPHINYYGLLSPHFFQGFYEGANKFGHPTFIDQDSVTEFLNSCRKRKKDKATKLVNMIRELRYTMDTLAKHPILVDTGQLIPKYTNRTYSDQQAEVANSLTNQPNFQAKVKLVTGGEYIIQTIKPTGGIEDNQKEARIRQIQQRTRQNYCKPRREVEREIRERQERLKAVENKPNPTSAKATQPQRTRRRTTEKIPPAWS